MPGRQGRRAGSVLAAGPTGEVRLAAGKLFAWPRSNITGSSCTANVPKSGGKDVEEVLSNPSSEGTSASTGRPCIWGYAIEGIYMIVAYEEIDPDTIRVVRAYKVPDPR